VTLAAQATPAAKQASGDDSVSKWDIFAGYSFLAPKGTVSSLQPDGSTSSASYTNGNLGMTMSGAYYFRRNLGVQVESAEHDMTVNSPSSNDAFFTLGGGLIYRHPAGMFTPFVHGLFGGARVGGPDHQPMTWGPALTLGGGVDVATPLFDHRLSIRLIQADYEYMHNDFGVGNFTPTTAHWGGVANINAVRLGMGVVLHFGPPVVPPPPVTLSCSAKPDWVFPGDPVTVTATAGNLDAKLNVIYNWSGPGVTGNGTTATVATGSLAPGTYTVRCEVKEGKPGKEGLKPGQSAENQASFSVRAFEPPTIGCTANPATIMPGEKSTITATGVSPQNRPLTYSYSATAGSIEGSGSSVTFISGSAAAGAVGITCNVSDDKGQTATASTSVIITAPPTPPPPHVSALCPGPIAFDEDKERPARVDNRAKGCLDIVTQALKGDSTAKVVVVGEATEKEKTPKKGKHAKVEDLAAERAINTKDYLVNEEQSGIDPSRISVRTGTKDVQEVENYLVPAGADFDADVPGTAPVVDESAVKKMVRKPIPDVLPVHHKAHKKHPAAKPAAAQPAK
jgi:hypothetical protein